MSTPGRDSAEAYSEERQSKAGNAAVSAPSRKTTNTPRRSAMASGQVERQLTRLDPEVVEDVAVRPARVHGDE